MNTYRYEDICLVPRYSTLKSRSNADTKLILGKHTFKLPVIPSNMKAVIDSTLAGELSNSGYMYSMHRFAVDIIESLSGIYPLLALKLTILL